ncbi:MAG: hypothetical protein IT548_09950 [Alphaproteobacteria bacterium]|nr:hypothetical protein [Alphaproteobacteria bacterium]
MTIGIAVELLVALLLATTIVWAVILDRRLRDLRSGRDGVRQAVIDLAGATGRAESAVLALREAAESTGAELARRQAAAKAASDELALLLGSAEGLADRLTKRAAPTAARAEAPRAMRELRGAR